MAVSTIFPGLITDIENRILSHMASQPWDLVTLSGTCTFAYGKLCNEKYFGPLFAAQYPLLAKTDQVFLQIRQLYPQCSWKAACCLMLKGYTPFKIEFLQRPILVITSAIQAQKEQVLAKKLTAEFENHRICGSYYQDPNSPIHQAWETLIKDKEEHDVFCLQKYEEIKKLLAPFDRSIEYMFANLQFIPQIDPEEVSDEIKTNGATMSLFEMLVHPSCLDLLSKDITVLEQHRVAEIVDLSRIEEYREVIPLLFEIKKNKEMLGQKGLESISKYTQLEEGRILSLKEARARSKELVWIEKNLAAVWRANQLHLIVDQYFAKNAERFAGNALMLFRVAHMCEIFNDRCCSYKDATDFSRTVKRFKENFNLWYEESDLIWEMLYHQCANGVVEDQWAEKHCVDLSEELVVIMATLQSLTTSFMPIYFRNLDLKSFVDEDYDVIKIDLQSLKKIKADLSNGEQKSFSELDVLFGTQGPADPNFNSLRTLTINLLFVANNSNELLPTVSSLIEHIER
jgi:hypothetical protein